MITLKKLGELPPKTRLRKISRILLRLEYFLRGLPSPDVTAAEIPDNRYLQALLRMVAAEKKLTPSLRDRAERYANELEATGSLSEIARPDSARPEIARHVSDIRYGLEEFLGHTPADWDFQLSPAAASATGDPASTDDAGSSRRSEPMFLYLDDVRSPFNVGAIFRAADSFAVRGIFLSEGCASPQHPRAARASMGTVDVIPWHRATLQQAVEAVEVATDGGGVALFAVETGGTPLAQFAFPAAGLAIVGAEELGVSGEALVLAGQSAGRVSLPTAGVKGSLNVAVATGIVLYQWWQAIVSQTARQTTR